MLQKYYKKNDYKVAYHKKVSHHSEKPAKL